MTSSFKFSIQKNSTSTYSKNVANTWNTNALVTLLSLPQQQRQDSPSIAIRCPWLSFVAAPRCMRPTIDVHRCLSSPVTETWAYFVHRIKTHSQNNISCHCIFIYVYHSITYVHLMYSQTWLSTLTWKTDKSKTKFCLLNHFPAMRTIHIYKIQKNISNSLSLHWYDWLCRPNSAKLTLR